MPTYVKLPKVLSDYAVGVESVNQMADNFSAEHDSFALRHGDKDPADAQVFGLAQPSQFDVLGAHDALTIPRAVVRVESNQVTPNLAFLACVGLDGVVPTFERLSTGIYFFRVELLSTFWGEFIPEAASVTPIYVCQPRSFYPTALGQRAGIYVECYDLSAGAFTLADMAGTLTVYGSRGA